MSSNCVLLVCQATKNIGIGHLARILVLADALKQQFVDEISIQVFGETVSFTGLDKFAARFVPPEQDFVRSVQREAEALLPAAVVFDLHPGSMPADIAELLNWLDAHDVIRIGVDGFLDFSSYFDLIWIPSFFIDPARLERCRDKVIYGWDTYLLRKLLPSPEWRDGNEILVLTGGSDSTGLGVTLPGELDAVLPEYSVIHWVRGPYARPPVLTKQRRLEWVLHDAPRGLDHLIVKSNYALAVFGISFFEVIQYGIPTVVFSPYGNKDVEELNALRQHDVAEIASDPGSAVLKLLALIEDEARGREISRNARSKLDNGGAANLARRIISMMDR